MEEIEENGYIVFNNKEQIEKYYNKNVGAYNFVKDENLLNVKFNFNLDVKLRNINASYIKANIIFARNINANTIKTHAIVANDIEVNNITADIVDVANINAHTINAHTVDAFDINTHYLFADAIEANNITADIIDAYDINYYAYCIAYSGLKCKNIEGKRENSIHKCLDKDIEYIN